MYTIPKHMINLFVGLEIFTNGDITDANTIKIKASQLPTETFMKTVMQKDANKIFSSRFSSPFGSLNQLTIFSFMSITTIKSFIFILKHFYKKYIV